MSKKDEALENHPGNYKLSKAECAEYRAVEDALREALAEQPAQQQEPIGWEYVVQLLIAAGYVSQEKVDHACTIAKAQQQEPVAKDAEEWGGRLNQASWAAIEAWDAELMGPMSGAVFNNIKGVVRAAILKYVKGYISPAASKPWVRLTDEEIDALYEAHHNQYGECETVGFGYERAIEAKLREKNA